MNKNELLAKPVWQMSGNELQTLLHMAMTAEGGKAARSTTTHLTGVQALAEFLNCSQSTVFMLRRRGVLDEAVVSQIGRKIVFDGNKARKLANDYQMSRR